MMPENVVEALDRVSVFPPRAAAPAPDSVVIVAPELVCEMSNVPESATRLEVAIVPAPESASVPPLIVVAPV